jgi:hypothetical protein
MFLRRSALPAPCLLPGRCGLAGGTRPGGARYRGDGRPDAIDPSAMVAVAADHGREAMKGKLISEGAQRTFAVILDAGDEAVAA